MRHLPHLDRRPARTSLRRPAGAGRSASVAVCAGMLATALAACDTGDGKQLQPVDPSMTTVATVPDAAAGTSPDDGLTDDAGFELFAPWLDGAAIDVRHTCDGEDISPALSWKSPPAGTVQLAFSLVDESSVVEGRPFIHWVMAGVEPADISLLEGVVPAGAVQGVNSFGETGWSGPCPPVGDGDHDYRLTMYALNQQVELADGTPATELLDFIEAVTTGSTDLSGTYQR